MFIRIANHQIRSLLFCSVLFLLGACSTDRNQSDGSETSSAIIEDDIRPNLLLIVADDLAYTDLGVYGGEIDTPNIDQLANDGLLFTDFHNQAVCAPTRAAIYAGMDNHHAGGAMHQADNQKVMPGYESYMNSSVVPFPQLLKEGGYNTYLSGKWHLGSQADQLPTARGFSKSFALMQGGASHYSDARGMFEHAREATYIENGQPVTDLPEDFYSSNFYTDYIINSIDEGANEKPWFAMLAFTAPHWPLHAPEEYTAKYKGVYDQGYEVLRANRIARAKALGVIPADAPTYPKLERVASWDSLSEEEKAFSSRKMEIYAGMVDALDKNVGRLIQHLKDIGEYENTYILFIADNGAEGADRDPRDNGTDWTFDNSLENMGKVGSHVYYSAGWAQAGVGVMRYFKSYSSEGGTRGPAILHHPGMRKAGQKSDAFVSVIDIAPTFLELAGVAHAEINGNGEPAPPIQGVSMVPMINGDVETVRTEDFVYGWEVYGHLAIRKGDWKLLKLSSAPSERSQPLTEKTDRWGLYDMTTDPGEVNDLAEQYPDIVAELLDAWEAYRSENGIVIPIVE